MEIAIPVVALGAMYIISNQKEEETSKRMKDLKAWVQIEKSQVEN